MYHDYHRLYDFTSLYYWGGGGGDMSIFESSSRKWPNTHTQKLFLSNGKIVYYQDVLQLPVPLYTLHSTHYTFKCKVTQHPLRALLNH